MSLQMFTMKSAGAIAIAAIATVSAWGASFYPIRLDDPRAVYVTPDRFAVRGDGVADDTGAIQQAIDKV